MASKIKVDEITTTGESGNIVIPGGVGLDGSAATSYWAIPVGNNSQRVAAPVGAIRYSTETDAEGLEVYVADSDGVGNAGWVLLASHTSGPDGTSSNPFEYVSQADGSADGMYYVMTSSSTNKEMYC